MAIVFIAGTTAEVIKVAPVMQELSRRDVPYRMWSTEQHGSGVSQTLADLGLRPPDRILVSGKGHKAITRVSQVPGWFINVAGTTLAHIRSLRNDVGHGVIVVHGDTFTTVLGALIGRVLRVDVAHIEAGLRSGSLSNPLPEELNRRIVGHLATIDFAPTAVEKSNLERLGRVQTGKAEVFVTEANTVVDALETAPAGQAELPDLPDRFGLVTLHRFELVQDRDEFEAILSELHDTAERIPLVFVIGQSENERLQSLGLNGLFSKNMIRIPKRSYSKFLPILKRASFVVTDSGGLQEECAALGKPCLVHRRRTERLQGIGENVRLSGLDLGVLRDFLFNWHDYERSSQVGTYHPSRLIADVLSRYTD